MSDHEVDSEVTEQVVAILEDPELSESDRIRKLYGMGFTRQQLQEMGFSRSNVFRVTAAAPKGNGGNGKGNGGNGSIMENVQMPLVLKAPQGAETMNPLAAIQQVLPAGSVCEDELQWLVRGFAMYHLAQQAVLSNVTIMKGMVETDAAALEPMFRLMRESREELDASAERARHSTMDAAREAGAEAAAGVAEHMDRRMAALEHAKPDIASTPNPMMGLMARTMEQFMGNMMNKMMPGMAGMAGQAMGGPAPMQQQPGVTWTDVPYAEKQAGAQPRREAGVEWTTAESGEQQPAEPREPDEQEDGA